MPPPDDAPPATPPGAPAAGDGPPRDAAAQDGRPRADQARDGQSRDAQSRDNRPDRRDRGPRDQRPPQAPRSQQRSPSRPAGGADDTADDPDVAVAVAVAPGPRRLSEAPSEAGRFGDYGGAYVPETLTAALRQLDETYLAVSREGRFWEDLRERLTTFVGRATPLYRAERLTGVARSKGGRGKGAMIWLKREDLAHTGAHKINNTMGQGLLCKRMNKKRVIAETGAGQHGVATATAAAQLGLQAEIYMGAEDIRRQRLNVVRMKLLGAKVIPVESGSRTLKDATNEAMRDWMGSVETTHYILGSVVGPHPFPAIVRDFQSIIGRECKGQCLRHMGRLPDAIVACVGGGSNAAGIFYPFIDDAAVALVGVEAGGLGPGAGQHAAPLTLGTPGILHGSLSYVLQDEFGQTSPAHSCSAGLDYPGVGPEHASWKDAGRVRYTSVTDDEALDAFSLLAQREGIIPALETAHAIAEAVRLSAEMNEDQHIVVCCSGRGDKDVDEATRLLGERGRKK